MEKITKIEKELEVLLTNDKKSWIKIYELMQEVEQERLYDEKYHTYTAWVNSFAERTKVHVSLLWNRKKAGKVYAEYEARQKDTGKEVVSMDNLRVSPDNFILVDKIAGNNVRVADDLINKVITGDLKRKDLKNAWNTVKAEREEAGKKVTHKNAYDKQEVLDINYSNMDKINITAADIVMKLSQSDSWITNRIIKKFVIEKYKIMTEFAVNTGTSRHARRIDVLVLENISVEDSDDIATHAIEIKVSKNDLLNDIKMQEYREFADYFWVAVPDSLEQYTKDIIVDGWGIITINKSKELKVSVIAKKYDAIFNDKTIKQALLQLL